jgi:3-deoxy-D-manno-octulosonate 8-phosphate phosphatase (KDO 8-P phosphatase)
MIIDAWICGNMGKVHRVSRDPKNIQLLVLDVDGVLTDGSLILGSHGQEYKVFNSKDGAAIKWWLRSGRQMAWISGRESSAVRHRAEQLGVQHVYQRILEKVPVYIGLLDELDIPENKTAYIGDDLVDLPIMSRCGFAISVADAMDEVRAKADLTTERSGGRGAVAEAVRFLLQAAGDWEKVMARYNQEVG